MAAVTDTVQIVTEVGLLLPPPAASSLPSLPHLPSAPKVGRGENDRCNILQNEIIIEQPHGEIRLARDFNARIFNKNETQVHGNADSKRSSSSSPR